MKKQSLSIIALPVILTLAGCAATQTMIEHRNLEVESQMSATPFLDPVAEDKKTILIQVRNTSDKKDFTPKAAIVASLQSAGYQVVTDPNKANFMLQANILKVGKIKKEEAKGILSAGFGGTLQGVAAGAALGSFGNRGESVIAGGLIGGAVETVSSSLVKNVAYAVVTDIRISERLKKGEMATETNQHSLTQGTRGSKSTYMQRSSDWSRQETRILSTAEKVNLKFEDAKPELLSGLANSISGIFG